MYLSTLCYAGKNNEASIIFNTNQTERHSMVAAEPVWCQSLYACTVLYVVMFCACAPFVELISWNIFAVFVQCSLSKPFNAFSFVQSNLPIKQQGSVLRTEL